VMSLQMRLSLHVAPRLMLTQQIKLFLRWIDRLETIHTLHFTLAEVVLGQEYTPASLPTRRNQPNFDEMKRTFKPAAIQDIHDLLRPTMTCIVGLLVVWLATV
jgi:hypothetical protein